MKVRWIEENAFLLLRESINREEHNAPAANDVNNLFVIECGDDEIPELMV